MGKGGIGNGKFAHLTGTFDYKFNNAQCSEMKQFVQGGGTLVIDVAGGNSKFAESAEAAIAAMFPQNKLEVLPSDHPLHTARVGEADEITYRNFAVHNGVDKSHAPRLQGITLNGRLTVVYSREHLSVGLVGQSVDGINGHSPETATKLMTRIINFVDGRPVPKIKANSRQTREPSTKPSKKGKASKRG